MHTLHKCAYIGRLWHIVAGGIYSAGKTKSCAIALRDIARKKSYAHLQCFVAIGKHRICSLCGGHPLREPYIHTFANTFAGLASLRLDKRVMSS